MTTETLTELKERLAQEVDQAKRAGLDLLKATIKRDMLDRYERLALPCDARKRFFCAAYLMGVEVTAVRLSTQDNLVPSTMAEAARELWAEFVAEDSNEKPGAVQAELAL